MPQGVRPRPMTADYAAHVRDDEVWVADDEGEIQGFLVLVPRGDHLLLDNVAVDPSAQGRGIGAALLALAEERARARHCRRSGCSPTWSWSRTRRGMSGSGTARRGVPVSVTSTGCTTRSCSDRACDG
jgi:GNAT superfamily N-acetyltransferase